MGGEHATQGLVIGGRVRPAAGGQTRPLYDHTGQPLGVVAAASAADVAAALEAAAVARDPWAHAPALTRSRLMFRVAHALEGRRDELTDLVAVSEGAHPERAAALVDEAVARWAWYAGWADKFRPMAADDTGTERGRTVTRPVGVVAVVAPQGCSLLGFVTVVAPMLVAGNTVVVAASEQRPLPALALAEVVALAGLDAGVLNVLTGDRDSLGALLATAGGVDALDLSGWHGRDTTALEEALARLPIVQLPTTDEPDFTAEPLGPHRILAFCRSTTISSGVDA